MFFGAWRRLVAHMDRATFLCACLMEGMISHVLKKGSWSRGAGVFFWRHRRFRLRLRAFSCCFRFDFAFLAICR